MSRKILIVDDNEINRELLNKILGEDYAIEEAENGKEAMKLLMCKHREISVILLDIIMPVMDGFAVLEKISKNPELSQIPVIVITGRTDHETEEQALNLGATDFLTKPFEPSIIKRRIRNLIKLRETSAMVNTYQKDKLTGVWNRETFFLKAAFEIKRKPDGYYLLSCIDVDSFKVINDRYGTEKGDKVLKGIAKMLNDDCEKNKGLCGRISADNFIVLYPHSLMEMGVAKQEVVYTEGIDIPVRLSIGRYIIDDKTLSVSAMYDRASIAQNTIKGRYDVNVAVYDETMRSRLVREQEIINTMNAALESGQFEAWLQPQYNHSTGALIGAEALARWRHPSWGLVSPGEFIPVFEQNGFVYELDKYIWEQVCAYLRKWIDAGRNPLPVSVNISRYDLFRDDLVEVIVGLIKKYGLSCELLRLEITESAFTGSVEHVVNVVERLLEYGFVVEIDDFGSGFSSLNTLKDVPAQVIKLDMRFFENSDNLDRGGNILESVIRMAKWLGMSVIAEGVEKKSQADFLKSIGCSYIQGYLYARPMPVNEYEALAKVVDKEERLITMKTVENLDSNSFWSSESIDTLIFSSYVGAACIFEYQNGKPEIIRVTDKYMQMMGNDEMSVEDMLNLDLNAYMDEEGTALLHDMVKRSIKNGDEVTGEFVFIDFPGGSHKTYLRTTLRVIATMENRSLIYCTNEDITVQREAEQKIRDANEQLQVLNDVAGELLAQPEIEDGINWVLQKILDHFVANRAYVIEHDDDKQIADNTYEVCADGVSSEMSNLQGVPVDVYSSWISAFKKGEYINIEDVSGMPDSRIEEKEILEKQGISSLIAVPLHRDGKLIGFVGVDDPTRRQKQVGQLQALGDYLAVMLTRRDLTEKVESNKKVMYELMDDTPGGFERIQLMKDGRMKVLYVNQRFCDLRGMTHEELMEKESEDGIVSVHPEDIRVVKENIDNALRSGEMRRLQYRLIGGDGEYICFDVFGRMTHSKNGDVFLNLYYEDVITQPGVKKSRKDTAEQLNLLLDSIPGGIAAYVASPDGVRITYFNDGFCRTLGYTREEYQNLSKDGITTTVFEEDVPKLMEQLELLIKNGKPVQSICRIGKKYDDEYKWINLRGSVSRRFGDTCYFSVVLTDITERQKMVERLRISETEYRLAMEYSDRFTYRYNHNDNSIDLNESTAAILGFSTHIDNVPQSLMQNGSVADESIEAYISFYDAIKKGDRNGNLTIRRKMADGKWYWLSGYFNNVYNEAGKPVSAIIVFFDVTEEREKEAVYKRWQQSLEAREEKSHTLLRWNLNRDIMINTADGSLLDYKVEPNATFIENTFKYASEYIYSEDREKYIAFINPDTLLADYHRNKRSNAFEYREIITEDQVRWLRLTIELVEYPNSSDVCVYMMYEDIDDSKKKELLVRERAELDPLTGVFNRVTFAAKEDELLEHEMARGSKSAFLMLDVDGFKLLNDTFGHAAGDQALIEISRALRSILRPDDLLGRLGGDEFLIGLKEMSDDEDIENKARQICKLIHKAYSLDVQISASLGVAVCPRDGSSFDELYRKADIALYSVKESGKDNYAFFSPEMDKADIQNEKLEPAEDLSSKKKGKPKRRMLIVEDSKMDAEMLASMFKNDFIIEKVRDGNNALLRMRHYGSAISVVLLDLIMPGMDGYEVLEKMQESEEMQSIPVVVVSASDDTEAGLKVIKGGAADFVTKPVDPNIIRIRVFSAVSKAENERLRAQNSFLLLQNDEILRYRTALESADAVVIEHDWKKGIFTYAPPISRYLAGNFDDRMLWSVFLSDSVANVKDVQAMQDLEYKIASDREQSSGSMTVMLKTPSKEKHRFRMNVSKVVNEFRLTDKIILTFVDLDSRAADAGR